MSWESEKLPQKDLIVLVALADPTDLTGPENEITPVWLGYWNGEEWLSVEGDSIQVTHWMLLPESPNQEGAKP
jgi:hypothetical protein